MVTIIVADKNHHAAPIRALFWEYLQWANGRLNQEFGVNFDIAALIEQDMTGLDKFMPPQGRLLLGYVNENLAGIACLKALTSPIGEIKRMYVRPTSRQQGVARALINQIVESSVQIGYERLRLDSARFMKEAHQLYRTTGFREIDAYEGSEVPREFQKHWIFMEMALPRIPTTLA